MFQYSRPKSKLSAAIEMAAVVYHTTARSIRSGHRNALTALAINIFQTAVLVLAFYALFSLLGLRGAKLRGDFLLYLLSGVFMFMTNIKTLSAVAGAAGPTSPMMQHSPMNTLVSIISAALGAFYIQITSLLVVLLIYHVLFTPVEIDQPIPALGMFVLAWFVGVAGGLLLLALKPWFPRTVNLSKMVYMRVNMIASGKMFIANALPAWMLALFDWNPLFHIIDQVRGFVFINYFPRNTSVEYPIYVGLALLVIGLLGEFYTRQHASSSWAAKS